MANDFEKIVDEQYAELQRGWRDGSTAPKDGHQFLADIGIGFAVVAIWSGYHEEFVYADVRADCVSGDEYNDTYFETESFIEIDGWMPMPSVKVV